MSGSWWGLTRLVARREWRERLGARSYRISTAVLVVAVALAVGLPALIGSGDDAALVGVTGGDRAAQTRSVERAGAVLDRRVRVRPFGDAAGAEAQLRGGDLDVVLEGDQKVLLEREPAAGTSDEAARLAGAIAQLAGAPDAQAPPSRALPVVGLKPAATDLSTRLTGAAAVVLIYVLVFLYGQRITSGVVEEKASRVVEVLLASVRPSQLLTGKVLGMAVAAFAQVGAVVVAFLVTGLATGSDLLHGAALGVVLVGASWLVLGYTLYSTAFAAAGSMITRESDASNVTFPLVLPLLFAYALSFGTVFGSSPSTLFRVLAYLPPTAPVASVTLYATGDIALRDVLIAGALSLVATALIARVASGIYERSILRMGARVSLRDALRSTG